MEFIKNIFEFIFHFDKHLGYIIQQCGGWTYGILFAVIFAETGLVVTPFLPGDSLLFVVGAFAAQGSFDVFVIFCTLAAAAVIGDSVNYAIGKYFGEMLVHARHVPFFKKEYIDKTHAFFEKYGGKTIIIARFVPIVRTFAPFVAGIGEMKYVKFFSYNVIGGIIWVAAFVFGGYFFGNIPIIKHNFSIVVMLIIVLSIVPGVVEYIKAHRNSISREKKA